MELPKDQAGQPVQPANTGSILNVASAPVPPKSGRPPYLILAIFLIVAMIGGGAFFFLKNSDGGNGSESIPSLKKASGGLQGKISEQQLFLKIKPKSFDDTKKEIETSTDPDKKAKGTEFLKNKEKDPKYKSDMIAEFTFNQDNKGLYLFFPNKDMSFKEIRNSIVSVDNKEEIQIMFAEWNPELGTSGQWMATEQNYYDKANIKELESETDLEGAVVKKGQGIIIMAPANILIPNGHDPTFSAGTSYFDWRNVKKGWVLLSAYGNTLGETFEADCLNRVSTVFVQDNAKTANMADAFVQVGLEDKAKFQSTNLKDKGFYAVWVYVNDQKCGVVGAGTPAGGEGKDGGGAAGKTYSPPTLSKSEAKKNSIILNISMPAADAKNLDKLTVQYLDDKGQKNLLNLTGEFIKDGKIINTPHTVSVDVKNKKTILTLNDLAYDFEYTFEITAVSLNGIQSSPTTVTVKTGENTQIKAPDTPIVSDKAVIKNSIVLQLTMPKEAIDDLKNFIIKYTDDMGKNQVLVLIEEYIDAGKILGTAHEIFADEKNKNLNLSLNELAYDHEYTFEIIAENKSGIQSLPATVTLKTEKENQKVVAPTTPQKAIIINTTKDTAVFEWKAPESKQEISFYKVRYQIGGCDSKESIDKPYNLKTDLDGHTKTTISNFTPATKYGISISAYNGTEITPINPAYWSEFSECTEFTTLNAISDLTGTQMLDLDAVKLEWTPANKNDSYKIYWNKDKNIAGPIKEVTKKEDAIAGEPYTFGVKGPTNDGKKQALIYGLPSGNNNFQVKNEAGKNGSNIVSLDIKASPLQEKPSQPEKPEVTGITTTSATIKWTAPTNGKNLSYYMIKYQEGGCTSSSVSSTLHGVTGLNGKTETTNNALKSGTTYGISVSATNKPKEELLNDASWSEFSQCTEFTTAKAPTKPSAPEKPIINWIKKDSAEFKWKATVNPKSNMNSYNVRYYTGGCDTNNPDLMNYQLGTNNGYVETSIDNLNEDQRYGISVSAYSEISSNSPLDPYNWSEFSGCTEFVTSVPKIMPFTKENYKDNELSVVWNMPSMDEKYGGNYYIGYDEKQCNTSPIGINLVEFSNLLKSDLTTGGNTLKYTIENNKEFLDYMEYFVFVYIKRDGAKVVSDCEEFIIDKSV